MALYVSEGKQSNEGITVSANQGPRAGIMSKARGSNKEAIRESHHCKDKSGTGLDEKHSHGGLNRVADGWRNKGSMVSTLQMVSPPNANHGNAW